jgi:hypothetical protein
MIAAVLEDFEACIRGAKAVGLGLRLMGKINGYWVLENTKDQ